MKQAIGVVEKGQVKLPESVRLPDGATVRVIWDEAGPAPPPFDREELTEEDVRADVAWASGNEPRP